MTYFMTYFSDPPHPMVQEYVREQIAFESAQQRQWASLLDVFENIPTVPLTQPF